MRSLIVPLAVLALLAGCTDSTTAPPPGPAGIRTNHTDPEALLGAFDDALSARDLDAYAALLEQDPGRADPGFRFYPQVDDLDDFPWLQGQPWDRATELGMIGNMCDPDFVSSETGEGVDTIFASSDAVSLDDLGDGEIEVTTTFVVTVLWAPETGARSDVRLIHVLAPDADGFLRIREQRELPLFGPRVENDGWAFIKALYR